jgi:Flp pilus assembly protein TadD
LEIYSAPLISTQMPDEHIDLYNRALDTAQTGNLTAAISLTEEALLASPTDQESWELYARLLNAVGRNDDAAKALEKLKSMGMAEAHTISIQASNALAKGQTEEAINLFHQAIQINPNDPDRHAALALALLQLEDLTAAITSANNALEIDPSHPQANYTLGHILRVQGKSSQALSALTKAVDAVPNFTVALYEQGMVLADCDRLEEALETFKKLQSIMPGEQNVRAAITNITQSLSQTKTY